MPYVPSKKTDGKSPDRDILDNTVEQLAIDVVERISNNLSVIAIYKDVFMNVSEWLGCFVDRITCPHDKSYEAGLALAVVGVGAKYEYEGAYLGELNYAITRFIQRVPQLKVKSGAWTQELRYWLYAVTVEALTYASYETRSLGIGVSGVFEDIKDEYKRRVNTAYEAEQIVKSGDCYDTPYYTRLAEVVDESGNKIGYQEIMLKRSDDTLFKDVLDYQIIVKRVR